MSLLFRCKFKIFGRTVLYAAECRVSLFSQKRKIDGFYKTVKFAFRLRSNCAKGGKPPFRSSLALTLPFIRKLLPKSKSQEENRDRVAGLHDEISNSDSRPTGHWLDDFSWHFLWNLLKPYFFLLLAAIAMAILAAVINIKIPLQLGILVNAAAALNDPAATLKSLNGPAIELISLYGIQSLLTACYISLLSVIGERTARDLRVRLFHSLLGQEATFFDQKRTGELVARLSGDVQEFKSCFKQILSQGLKSITQTIGCTISLYLISPQMTMAIVSLLPCIVLIGSVFGSILRKLSQLAQKQVGIATAVADEALGNIRTVKSFAMEGTEEKMYERELERSRKLNEILGFGIGVFQGLSNLVINGIVLAVIYGGSHLMNNGEITAGQLMSFLVTSQVVQKSLGQTSLLFGQVVKGASAATRIFEYMHHNLPLLKKGTEIIAANSLAGEVRFIDVDFSYPTRPDFAVFKGFSLVIPPGKKVALCGPSGGGKSTSAALLERFYDVNSGRITIDGKNLKQLDTDWLRGKIIGFISQEPVLFHTTIKENIRYGKPEATDEEIYAAAKTANAESFIKSFPAGYHTVVGERGVSLSGGQKQRIAIARALLKNPPILILDEATSALDAESERLVQEALENAEKGRTVLVIAHRLSTVRNADYIAVVANKKIAEIGTYEQLMRKKGAFWQLAQHQRFDDD